MQVTTFPSPFSQDLKGENHSAIRRRRVYVQSVNLGKVALALAATITRLILVIVGTLTILPMSIAFLIHHRVRRSKGDSQSTALKVNRFINALPANNPLKGSLVQKGLDENRGERLGEQLENTPQALEALSIQAKRSIEGRASYFEAYNTYGKDFFTRESVISRFPEKGEPDLHLINLSRESYLALTLVYRFDGPAMVGKRFNLGYEGKDGAILEDEYIVDKYFEDSQGLVGYGLKSVNQDSEAPPRIIFRGTNRKPIVYRDLNQNLERKLPTGIVTDFSCYIGKAPYERWKEEIRNWLSLTTHDGKNRAIISGHSLGGALAQRVAVDNPELIARVFTINSPRLERKAIQSTLEETAVHHVVMGGDRIIPKVGGRRGSIGGLVSSGHPDADEVVFIEGGGHVDKRLNDYCLNQRDFRYSLMTTGELLRRDSFTSAILNFLRPQIGFLQ